MLQVAQPSFVVAGRAIILFGGRQADAIASIAISFLILVGALRLVRYSVDVLIEGAPRNVPATEVERLPCTG